MQKRVEQQPMYIPGRVIAQLKTNFLSSEQLSSKEMGLQHPAMVLAALRRLSSMRVLERNEEGAYRINERTEEWEGGRLHGLTFKE